MNREIILGKGNGIEEAKLQKEINAILDEAIMGKTTVYDEKSRAITFCTASKAIKIQERQ